MNPSYDPVVDWQTWHDDYDDPATPLARRLAVSQARIRESTGDTILGVCAGQGRDLLGALPDRPVRARLVELDPRNVEVARRNAPSHVEVVEGDAALLDHYEGLAPADLVLMCGVFGNISDDDVKRTVGYCRQLTAQGGSVIWTRHRRPPDLVPQICRWFEEAGFDRVWLSDPDAGFGVGVHRFTGTPEPLSSGAKMFTFLGCTDPRKV